MHLYEHRTPDRFRASDLAKDPMFKQNGPRIGSPKKSLRIQNPPTRRGRLQKHMGVSHLGASLLFADTPKNTNLLPKWWPKQVLKTCFNIQNFFYRKSSPREAFGKNVTSNPHEQTKNEEQGTTNGERRTMDEERRTKNGGRFRASDLAKDLF